MNLIEQLGGYERAKSIANCKSGIVHPTQQLLDALLEYRREHNIFEVGDKVVWKESLSIISSLMEIESLDGDTWGIRHATDAEIKSGRKL